MTIDERFFLRFNFEPKLFFASGVVIPDGGGMDDMGGGDAGTGDDGGQDDGGNEGADEGEGSSEGDEGAEAGDEESDSESDAEGEGDEADAEEGKNAKGARTPEQFEKSLRKLKEIDPVAASMVRKEHFQNQDFKKWANTPAEAREMRETLDDLGGTEGIAEMQTDVRNYEAELSKFADGDPTSIDDLVRDFPGSLEKLAPHAVSKLESVNPTQYQRMMAKHTIATLDRFGVSMELTRMADALGYAPASPQNDKAKAIIAEIQTWLQKSRTFSEQKTEQAGPSAKEKDIETREAKLRTETEKAFHSQVGGAINQRLSQVSNRHLGPLISGIKMNPAQRTKLVQETAKAIESALQGDARYQRKVKALVAGKNVNAIARFVASEADAKGKQAAKAAFEASAWSRLAKTKRADPGAEGKGASANGKGKILVNTIPSPETIDWSKDRNQARFIAGEATLLSGKVVRWDINKVRY